MSARAHQCNEEPEGTVEWHLDDPAHTTCALYTKVVVQGGVPQGTCSWSAMKAASRVPLRDTTVALYLKSKAFTVSRTFSGILK